MRSSVPPLSILSLCFAFSILSVSCERPPETLVTGGYDEVAMDTAIEEARQHVDYFIAALAAGEGENFAVKAPVTDGENTEHFWLVDISYSDGTFSGMIGNEAGLVETVDLGDAYSLEKTEISDWMFVKDGLMHGSYTSRVLLPTMGKNEADHLRSQLAKLPE